MPPAPPTRPRLRAKYDQRRRAVLDTAAQMFAERGYHATSMADLIEATGLTAGGLYHYIGTKDALLLAIFDELMEPLLEQAEAIVAAEEPAEARLRALVRAWMAHVETHRDHMLVFQQEQHTARALAGWPAVRDQRKRFENLLRAVLERAHEEDGVPEDPHLARLALLSMVNYTPQWFRPDGSLSADEVADGYYRMIIR